MEKEINIDEMVELANEVLPLITAMSRIVGKYNGKDNETLYSVAYTTDGEYLNISLGSHVSVVKTAGFPARVWVSKEESIDIDFYDLEGEEC